MSDLVERQAAIDAAIEAVDEWDGGCSPTRADMIADAINNTVPSAQTDLIAKIQNGINITNADDSYSCGMRNGMRWCMSLVDDKEPLFENCPPAQPEQRWIPVKTRPMDSDEREYWEDQFGEKLEDEDAVMFDCLMPEDGQEILVSYRKWICMDKCEIDGGCYGLEGNGDWEDVVAWMPLPKSYSGK